MNHMLTTLLLLPLAGAIFNRLWGSGFSRKTTGIIACLSVGLSFVLSVACFLQRINMPELDRVPGSIETLFTWATVGTLQFNFSLLHDPLSAVMLLIVTGIGLLIHIFSTWYMEEENESEYARYFAYLNFFIFSMLTLVLAANFIVMFVGWELVGVSSYLLIGYFRGKKSAADAGKKAFIVNRVGDLGFLLAILIIIEVFQTVEFGRIFPVAGTGLPAGSTLATVTALLLFMGAMGKSAQMPLHVWLPDAMEGPTPVSALIHAATMVTAGVFMVARCHAIFELAPIAMTTIAWIGAFTAFFAATVALVQNDIKRVMAYSTLSQLGYMIMAVGVGAYAAGFFHLLTHAFFKALLFLACGSVMHALHGELDMAKMGALKNKLPTTFKTFTIGAACLVGIPLTSGFFSKDEILWEALVGHHHSLGLWTIGALTAGLTALYVSRLYFKVFFGTPRDQHIYDHAHEGDSRMSIPLWTLAVGSLVVGFLGLPHVFHLPAPLLHWLDPVFKDVATGENHGSPALAAGLMLLYTGMAVGAMWFCWKKFGSETGFGEKLKARISPLYNFLWNKWYFDELYQFIFVDGLLGLSKKVWVVVDQGLIDGIVNGAGQVSMILGGFLKRRLHTGYVRYYAGAVIFGTILILAVALNNF